MPIFIEYTVTLSVSVTCVATAARSKFDCQYFSKVHVHSIEVTSVLQFRTSGRDILLDCVGENQRTFLHLIAIFLKKQ